MPKDSSRDQLTRCAIYTRKSTAAGLEQDFTSLDAQREACEAYVASQKHAGWRALPTRYDDGGFTGATLDRPALQHLLAAIAAGQVDCVIVYKVDRLSRSLLDFSQLLDQLDQHDVTFVSVTQHFNTQTSMGRLTLNILLSFAQFEREMISERTRDKMGAARRKGKWLGGQPPVGYDVSADEPRRLVVNPTEAALVRDIYEAYLRKHSILAVVKWLNDAGHRTKQWTTKTGRSKGGKRYSVPRVQAILSNPTYRGKVHYAGELYDGEHEAIIPDALWLDVAALRARNRRARSSASRATLGMIPGGLLHCRYCGSVMYHTYSQKGIRRYRYYVCTNAQQRGREACPTRWVSAECLERGLVESLRALANDREQQTTMLATLRQHQDEQRQRLHRLIADLEPSTEAEDEQRLSALRMELATLESECVGPDNLRQALSVIDKNWEVLALPQRAQLLTTLLERADYDGAGVLGLTLRARGIRSLSAELAEEEVRPCR